jgi:hypothetical protein
MPKRTLLLFLSFFALSCAVFADNWHKEYRLTDKPDLHVETGDANVRVEVWDTPAVDITVDTENWKIGPGHLEITESQTGNIVNFKARQHAQVGFGFNHHQRADVTIRCPREGRFDLHTNDGRLEASHLKGDIALRTGDGHLTASDLDGTVSLRSGDGRIAADGRFDGVDARSGDGAMDITARPGSKMNREWTFRAGDGSIRLHVPKDFAASLDVHTGDGHLDLDIPVTIQGRVANHTLRGTLNGGVFLLSMRTGDGSIHLSN